MKKRVLATLIPAAVAAFALTVCAAETPVQLGEKVSDSDYEVTLVNETGKDIKEAALRMNYAEEFSDNLLKEEVVFEDGSEAVWYCTPGEMVNFVPCVYDLKLTFDDDTEATLHTLPMGDADSITILMEDDVAYVSFTSKSLNYETDTKRRETEISEIGEKVLVADYQAKVAGGGASYSGGGYSGGGDGGGGGEEAPAPDQCLTDGLLN